MNLQKVLAENMIRFGVKNLNAQSYKTLLNEGIRPGDPVSPVALELDTDLESSSKTQLATAIGKYGKNNKVLSTAALLAVAAGAAKLSAVNKSIKKNHRNVISFKNLLAGNGDRGGFETNENAAVDAILLKSANFTYDRNDIAVYPDPRGTGFVATLGRAGNSPQRINDFSAATTEVTKQGEQSSTSYTGLIRYLTQFNLSNVSDGDFTQYNLSSMLDTENYVNLLNAQVATNTVIVYTATTNAPDAAGKTVDTTTQGAAEPIDKNYDVSFNGGDATVPTNDSEVAKAVADAIAMFPDGNITNLSIVSSASPEFNSKQGGPATLADYGTTPVTGTGQPTVGNDYIGKNIKLAYDRGVNFIAAINAGLAAQGKPEIQGYNINWQISDKDGTKVPGRYAKVLWSKAGTPGTDVTNLDNTGKAGTVTSGGKTYTIFQHVFTAV